MRSPALALAFLVGLLAWSFVGDRATAPRLEAQIRPGEFAIYQSDVIVGWVWCNCAGTVEYWAYVDGVYKYPDVQNTREHRLNLGFEYIGATSPACFSAWQRDVSSRAGVCGHTVTFKKHTIE